MQSSGRAHRRGCYIGGVEAPTINAQYACIVDRDAFALAAVISSHLFMPATYLPVFMMRRVLIPRNDNPAFMSESYLAYAIAEWDGVLICNALARMGWPNYLIIAGLNEAQKSYLDLSGGSKIIEIQDATEIEAKLSPLGIQKRGLLRCKSSDLLNGLFVAQTVQKTLLVDEQAPPLPEVVHLQKGMVVVESVPDASPVIAINYANSVGASVLVVECLPKHEGRNVQVWIQEWKEKDDHKQFEKLNDAVQRRIGGTSFTQFEYVTFFTEGLPYSLILGNVIPCSYVHLSLRADLFIINNILFKDGEPFHASVVFSPTFFPDEETNLLCRLLKGRNYYVRALVGNDANLANFSFHAEHFPYDLLHICSHGGEVDGYEMSEQFVDRDGRTHVVEFDEVIGVTPVPDKQGIVAIHRKAFPRQLDGFTWMSPELEKQGLPGHVFQNMWKCMTESQEQRKKKNRIALSCAIACADSIHQGQFDALASYSSPLIFNNSCWSWYEIAAGFLASGARGYVGTLWAIDNQAAVTTAKTFYESSFSGSILSAFHKAIKAIDATASKNIFIFWGLHFAKLTAGRSIAESQNQVQQELDRAAKRWARKVQSTKSAEIRRNSIKVIKSILQELVSNFGSVHVGRLEREINSTVPELASTAPSESCQPPEPPARCSSADYPVEYKGSNN